MAVGRGGLSSSAARRLLMLPMCLAVARRHLSNGCTTSTTAAAGIPSYVTLESPSAAYSARERMLAAAGAGKDTKTNMIVVLHAPGCWADDGEALCQFFDDVREASVFGVHVMAFDNDRSAAAERSSPMSGSTQLPPAVAASIVRTLERNANTLTTLSLPFLPVNDTKMLADFATVIGCCGERQLASLMVTGSVALVKRSGFLGSICLSRCSHLKTFQCGQCEMEDSQLVAACTSLSSAVGGWGQLQRLDLSQGRWTQRGWELFGDAVGTAETKLGSLALQSCGIQRNAMFALSRGLGRCGSSLHSLNLRHNKLNWDGAVALNSVLLGCSELRVLELSRNRNLHDDGIIALMPGMSTLAELEELSLSNCGMTVESFGEVSETLQRLDALVALDLSDNELSLASRKLKWEDIALQRALKSSQVDEMSWHSSKREERGRLPAAFETERRRRRRSSEGTTRNDDEKEEEAEAQPAMSNERESYLVHPLLRWQTAAATIMSSSLESLNLSGCSLNDAELAAILSPFSTHRSSLKDLSVASNKDVVLTEEVATCIASGTSPLSRSLERISFSGCHRIGDVGVAVLCETIAAGREDDAVVLTQLKTLDLSGCGIGADGWEALLCDGFQLVLNAETGAYSLPPNYCASDQEDRKPFCRLEELLLFGNVSQNPVTDAQLKGLLLAAEHRLPNLRIVHLAGSLSPMLANFDDDIRTSIRRLSSRIQFLL